MNAENFLIVGGGSAGATAMQPAAGALVWKSDQCIRNSRDTDGANQLNHYDACGTYIQPFAAPALKGRNTERN